MTSHLFEKVGRLRSGRAAPEQNRAALCIAPVKKSVARC